MLAINGSPINGSLANIDLLTIHHERNQCHITTLHYLEDGRYALLTHPTENAAEETASICMGRCRLENTCGSCSCLIRQCQLDLAGGFMQEKQGPKCKSSIYCSPPGCPGIPSTRHSFSGHRSPAWTVGRWGGRCTLCALPSVPRSASPAAKLDWSRLLHPCPGASKMPLQCRCLHNPMQSIRLLIVTPFR